MKDKPKKKRGPKTNFTREGKPITFYTDIETFYRLALAAARRKISRSKLMDKIAKTYLKRVGLDK